MDLVKVLKQQNVGKENAERLIKAFGAPFTEAGEILATYQDIEVTDESQTDLMAMAKQKRLALKKIRTGVENKRKELKEDSLRTGEAIDGVAKYIKTVIEPAEKYLELQEKFADVKKAERAAAVKAERIEKLSAYTDNLSIYNLDTMEEATFQMLLGELKANHDAKVAEAARVEAGREAQAKADAEAAQKQREENERLKKEAEEREVWVAKVKSRINKLHAIGFRSPELDGDNYTLDQIVITQQQIDLCEDEWFNVQVQKAQAYANERNAAVEKERRENEAKVEAERAQTRKLEQEKAEREAAEAKAKSDAEEAKRQALLAPDKEKLLKLADLIDEIQRPALSSSKAQAVLTQTEGLLVKVSAYIRGNVKGL